MREPKVPPLPPPLNLFEEPEAPPLNLFEDPEVPPLNLFEEPEAPPLNLWNLFEYPRFPCNIYKTIAPLLYRKMGNTTTRVAPYDEEAPPMTHEQVQEQVQEQPQDGTTPLSEIIVHIITDMFYTHKRNVNQGDWTLGDG